MKIFSNVAIFGLVLAITPTTTDEDSALATYTVAEPQITAQGKINHSSGPVMNNGVNVYGIFYGDHSEDTKAIIARFVNGLSGSEWWGVVQTYYGDNGPINANVNYVGSYHDNYSKGKSLSSTFFSSDLNTIINNAIVAASWPKDVDGVYVVFTSKDVQESSSSGSYCKDYCGYHGMNGNLKTTMIGDATACPGTLPPPGQKKGTPGCMQRYYRNQTDPTYSINSNQNADSMIDVLSHELAEAASDYANAWRDGQGYENGDKCAPYFVNVQGVGATSPYNGAYNVDFGAQGKYLIQSMWSAKQQKCVLTEKGAAVGEDAGQVGEGDGQVGEFTHPIRLPKPSEENTPMIKIRPMF